MRACELNCPVNAITVHSGVGCAAGIIQGLLNNTGPVCDCSGEKQNVVKNSGL